MKENGCPWDESGLNMIELDQNDQNRLNWVPVFFKTHLVALPSRAEICQKHILGLGVPVLAVLANIFSEVAQGSVAIAKIRLHGFWKLPLCSILVGF